MSQMKMEHTLTPEVGRYDFDGACAPHGKMSFGTYTFTLGIFQWEPKGQFAGRPADKLTPKMLKRSRIFKRVKGQTGKPQPAYDEARRLCAGYNNGTLIPPLSHAQD